MIKDFVLNAALLIASFFIMGQVFKNRPLQVSSPFLTKFYWGLCFGVLGNILMLFSIKINPTTIADLRHLAIVIPAAFGGFIPAFIASVIISSGRIYLFGYSYNALLAALGVLFTGIVCGGISKLKFHMTFNAFLMNLSGLVIISILLFINIDDKSLLKSVLLGHYLISLTGGFLAYFIAEYIAKSNEAQLQLKFSVIKLKESEERFRLLAEYSSDMITMHNENREFIYISPAVNEIIKYEYPELLGKKIESFIHPDDISHTNEMFEKALNNGFADSTYRYCTKMGEYIWIESKLKSVHFQEGGSKRVIIVSRNITDRKLTEHKLKEANELLNRLSYMDGLTGVSNRRYFDHTLEKECSNLSHSNLPLTLIMFDIDYFKKYNDTYGHLAGDLCLQTIAQTIKNEVTGNKNYTFSRYGGEEFAIILPLAVQEEGFKVAQKIQQLIESLNIPHSSSEIAEIVTLSIGIASFFPNSKTKPQELIHMADTALYLSKTKGRNTISIVQ
ncbi:diguanylate cyclase domain-containing protein [Neobacillus ginsengisoli]|uniref:Diguanylate cyclase (GGDEF)-like protein/PAS domain S-box-containing protein n=1 Tax=Neobacillus ginsengisoli TaxID=904295 RepID=A0ABT9XSU5_9BACI|nr:diguanylate cyclase [Neobacillus ginsengisoli]MDQ0198012.1 diguanylate cyclase (GGDEF)-like protein/PAS domain S-box-containing protein [Neobacillus ginsengisoli]